MSDAVKEKSFDILINRSLLIKSVEQRPVIWDNYLKSYKDMVAKEAAWREIYLILMKDFDRMNKKDRQIFGKCVHKRWTQIRDAWLKSLRPSRSSRKSSNNNPSRPYKYDKELRFLKKVVIESYAAGIGNREDDKILEESSCEKTKALNNQEVRLSPLTKKKKVYEVICNEDENEERHLTFFKSLLPSLKVFNDDQTLEFQSGVINLIRSIKRTQPYIDWSLDTDYTYQCQSQSSFIRPDVVQSPSEASTSTQSHQSESKTDIDIE